MAINISSRDIIWSYISNAFCMGANFLLLPVVIACLNDNELGLWYVFLSIGSLFYLFDFGFSVTLARNITYCWSGVEYLTKDRCNSSNLGTPNFLLMKKVVAVSKIIYGVITIAVLIMLLFLGTLYLFYVTRNMVLSQWIASWIVFVFSLSINMYYGYYNSFLYGVGAIEIANKIRVYARFVQVIATLIVLVLDGGLLGISFANLIYGVIFRYLGKNEFYKYQDIGNKIMHIEYKISKYDVRDIFNIVWYNAWRDGFIGITNFITDQFTTMLCALYVSLKETGMYAMVVQIVSAIVIFSSIVYNAYQPRLQSAWANNDSKTIRDTMSIIVSSYVILFTIGVIAFIVIIYPLLVYFKPNISLSVTLCLLICIYQFCFGLRNCYTSYFSCSNRIIYLKAFVYSSIFFICVSFMCEYYFKMGIKGIILSQMFSQGMFNFWYWIKMGNEEMNTSLCALIVEGTRFVRKRFVNLL